MGVWQRGTALLLGKSLENTDKKLYLADTFTDVVNASEVDAYYIGRENADTSVDFVTEFLNSELHQNFELLVGEFPTATGDLVLGPLSFVHTDVGVYDSGKSILD